MRAVEVAKKGVGFIGAFSIGATPAMLSMNPHSLFARLPKNTSPTVHSVVDFSQVSEIGPKTIGELSGKVVELPSAKPPSKSR